MRCREVQRWFSLRWVSTSEYAAVDDITMYLRSCMNVEVDFMCATRNYRPFALTFGFITIFSMLTSSVVASCATSFISPHVGCKDMEDAFVMAQVV